MKKFLNYHHITRYGLGVIFIANALVAFFAPTEFIEIIKNSFALNLLPLGREAFTVVIIGLNDTIVGLFLLFGFATRRVAIWAAVWIIGVIVVIGNPFDILEHLGLLLMAIALFLDDRYVNSDKKL
jgi:uncharacterized membrane protein YphA (DoxX/SURF4 family)